MIIKDRERKIENYNKFLPHIKRIGVNFDKASELNNIVQAINSGDIYLNSIPLWKWDMYHFWYKNRSKDIPTWSMSDSVCVAKIAALIAGLKVILGENTSLTTGEEIVKALENMNKRYYAVNFNPVGYLPESEPYDGLENVDEIMDAIDSICYLFEDSEGIDPNLELPEKRHIREMLTELIDKNQLEHETIGYIGDYCIFVYKDDEYEYRQSK